MQQLIKVTIPNWEKFNARSDRANYTWFRMQNNFLHDHGLFETTDAQKVLYLFILCEVSKKNRGDLEISVSYAAAMLKKSEKEIRRNLQRLIDLRLIAGEEPSSRHQLVESLPATDRQTDRQTIQTDTPTLDFESVWKSFPRKDGKSEARVRFERLIRNADDYLRLTEAIAKYRSELIRRGTEAKYVKQLATFLGTEDKQSWRDWLEPDAGTTDLPPPDPGGRPVDPKILELRRMLEREDAEAARGAG